MSAPSSRAQIFHRDRSQQSSLSAYLLAAVPQYLVTGTRRPNILAPFTHYAKTGMAMPCPPVPDCTCPSWEAAPGGGVACGNHRGSRWKGGRPHGGQGDRLPRCLPLKYPNPHRIMSGTAAMAAMAAIADLAVLLRLSGPDLDPSPGFCPRKSTVKFDLHGWLRSVGVAHP